MEVLHGHCACLTLLPLPPSGNWREKAVTDQRGSWFVSTSQEEAKAAAKVAPNHPEPPKRYVVLQDEGSCAPTMIAENRAQRAEDENEKARCLNILFDRTSYITYGILDVLTAENRWHFASWANLRLAERRDKALRQRVRDIAHNTYGLSVSEFEALMTFRQSRSTCVHSDGVTFEVAAAAITQLSSLAPGAYPFPVLEKANQQAEALYPQ